MDLLDFLETLPIKLAKVYDSPYTSLAVVKSLPLVAKQYVMRMALLSANMPVHQAVVNSWADPTAKSTHDVALNRLARLQLVLPTPDNGVMLEPIFRAQLLHALSGGLVLDLETEIDSQAPVPVAGELDAYAWSRWENVLLHMVGSSEEMMSSRDEISVPELLASAGLIIVGSDGLWQGVTEAGFKFLLADTYSQIWSLLREYISTAEEQSSIQLASVLSFLLQLGHYKERVISIDSISVEERNVAEHMVQLGLLYKLRSSGRTWLCPTKLAAIMTSGGGGGAGAGARVDEGFIIVETNYRVYAYTSSAVRQAILRLFVRCDALLPNLFVGTITRESVKSALESGISAEQIVGFLRQHAHARVVNNVPIVPGVVADQIRLWYRELHRCSYQPAVWYKNFESAELYMQTRKFIESSLSSGGGAVYRNDDAKEVVVLADAHDEVKGAIKSLKQQLKL